MRVGEGVSRVVVLIIRKHVGGVTGFHSCVLEESSNRCSNFGNIFGGNNVKLEFWW